MREQVKYGLPAEVRFCKKCVMSNQRPNSTSEFTHKADSRKETIRIDDEGVCDACRVAARAVVLAHADDQLPVVLLLQPGG